MDIQAFRPISDTQGKALRHAVPRGDAHRFLRIDESLVYVAFRVVIPFTGRCIHCDIIDSFLHYGGTCVQPYRLSFSTIGILCRLHLHLLILGK